jgi:SAM-dependent methyltransferase
MEWILTFTNFVPKVIKKPLKKILHRSGLYKFQSDTSVWTTDDYILNQDQAYANNEDPWCNFSGPRFRILNLHYNVVLSMLEDHDRVVADLGCGLGKFTKILSESGRTVTGVDTSEIAIEKAKTRYPELSFLVGDVRTWKPYSGMLDAIFLMDCYHRMTASDKAMTLSHVKSILKPGGKMIVAYGNDFYLSGKQTDVYPDISKELFAEFEPLQIVSRQAIDTSNGTENSNTIYVGLNRY